MAFIKAVKYDSKLRLSIAGPSGSGKTWTALTLATVLAEGKPIAVIDTERGSASKYADQFSFYVDELDTFHPDNFIKRIHEAEQAGYAVLIIDSLSHAWNGTGGLLEIVDQITKRSSSKNSFNAWGDATPIQNRMIDAITRSPMHIIVTMRSKAEYVVEYVDGKSKPRKVGTAPIQRDGTEYEFDVVADMDIDNTMIIQKSRCPALSGKVISKPDAKVADVLKAWLQGVPAEERKPTLDQIGRIAKATKLLNRDAPEVETYEQADKLLRELLEEYNKKPMAQPVLMS
jgi:AAA domain